MIGQVINNYRVTERIGAGGMGEVYKAEHSLIGRRAAIKRLLTQYSSNKDLVRRFFNEAKAASSIRHPGIVEILDFGYHDDGSAYILMEYLEGETLKARMRRMGTVPADMALHFVRQIAGALAAAHEQGIVHRDLKPDNIFIVADPEVAGGERIKLLDFGIAKLMDEDNAGLKTSTGMVMGTPAYMAPEQCKGAGRVDSRADLYSLGCIVFHMLSGRPPFVAEGSGEVMAQQIYAQPQLPSALAPAVTAELDAFVLALLAKEPGMRPQTARDVITALDALYHGATGTRLPTDSDYSRRRMPSVGPVQTTLSAGAGAVSMPAEPGRGRGRTVVAMAALATLLIGLGVFALLPGSAPETAVGADDSISDSITNSINAPADDEIEIEPAAAMAPEPAPVEDPERVAAEPAAIEPAAIEPMRVVIESRPEASVFRGDSDLGPTPYTAEIEPGSEQRYVLKRRGYHDAVVHLPTDAGDAGKVTIDLERVKRARESAPRPRKKKKAKEDVLRKGGSLPL